MDSRRVSLSRVLLALNLAVMVSIVLTYAVMAESQLTRSKYLKKGGPDTAPYRVILKCDGYAEDSLAHIKLKRFTPERVVYKCSEGGY